ncbi:ATP-binding cassette domain-containing protein [Mesomycoplasma dispar]|nr:ABC transporter ATP-binding protein [Mesomycoplasma dispar]
MFFSFARIVFALFTTTIAIILLSKYWGWIVFLNVLFSGFIIYLTQKKYGPQFQEKHKTLSDASQNITKNNLDILNNFKLFYFHSKTKKISGKILKNFKIFTEKQIPVYKWSLKSSSISTALVYLFNSIGFILILLLTVFKFYEISIFIPLTNYSISLLQNSINFLSNLMQYWIVKSSIVKIFPSQKTKIEKINLLKPIEKIQFQNVSFGYDENLVIKNLNLMIENNKKYALMSKSGSGKSTLVKLMSGIYDNYQGNIIINEKYQLKDLDFNYIRSQMAIIDNQNIIFPGNIVENITLFSKNPDFAKLNQIISELQANWMILEQKVDSSTLSEGQKQLIVLARLLYHEMKIWIVDEALDNIQKDLSSLFLQKLIIKRNITLIYVSHHIEKENLDQFDKLISL